MFGIRQQGRLAEIKKTGASQENKAKLIQKNSLKLLDLIGTLKASKVQDSDIVAVLVGNKSLESLNLGGVSLNKLTNHSESLFIESSGCFFSGHFIEPELAKVLKNDTFKSTHYFGFGNSKDTKQKLAKFENSLKFSGNGFKESRTNIYSSNVGSNVPPPPARIKTYLQATVQAWLNDTLKNFNSKDLGSSLKEQYALDYARSSGVFLKIAGKPVLITELIDIEMKVTPKFNELFKENPEQAENYRNLLPILIRQDYRSIVMMPITISCSDERKFIFPGISDGYSTEIDIQGPDESGKNLQIDMKFKYRSQDEKGKARSLDATANLTMSTEFIKKSVNNNYENSDFGVSEIKITEFDYKNPLYFEGNYAR